MSCKHKFQPRYSKEWSTILTDMCGHKVKANRIADEALTPYLKKETYIHDICVKCGTTVKCS